MRCAVGVPGVRVRGRAGEESRGASKTVLTQSGFHSSPTSRAERPTHPLYTPTSSRRRTPPATMAAVAPPPPALERGESRARTRAARRAPPPQGAPRTPTPRLPSQTPTGRQRARRRELATSARRPLALASSDAGRSPPTAPARAPPSSTPRARRAGVGPQRGRHFAGEYYAAPIASLPPADEMALRHCVQQLSDYARSELLGAVADYVLRTPTFPEAAPRARALTRC